MIGSLSIMCNKCGEIEPYHHNELFICKCDSKSEKYKVDKFLKEFKDEELDSEKFKKIKRVGDK